MNLKLITLSREVFNVDIEPTKTILDLKKKISEVKNFDANNQKIIFKGKILNDNEIIETFNFKETDTIVVMELKKKVVSKPQEKKEEVKKEEVKKEEKKETKESTSGTTEASQTSAPAPVPAPAPATTQPTVAAPTTESNVQSTTSGQNDFSAGSNFISGEAYKKAVDNLVEMGFERRQVMIAMKASYNNPDRAAEYLMNGMAGIPVEAEPEPAASQGASNPQSGTTNQPTTNQSEALFEEAARALNSQGQNQDGLAALRDNPNIQRIRELVASNPQVLQSLIQHISQSNPDLLLHLLQNPEEFNRLLQVQNPEMNQLMQEGNGEGEEALPPGAVSIEITQEESEAIGRLEALGFDRQLALEAYIICDKNEELAANYLFNAQNEQWD